MKQRFILLFTAMLVVVSGSVYGAEYRKLSDQGTNAGSIAIGNIIGIIDNSAGVLQSPVGAATSTGVSLFYSTMMDDQSLESAAMSFKFNPDLSIGIGGILESISGIYGSEENESEK
ncbi:hypothetical protein EBR96_09355, partial [bacterium]|nr:hypothetical protein [bacterium]